MVIDKPIPAIEHPRRKPYRPEESEVIRALVDFKWVNKKAWTYNRPNYTDGTRFNTLHKNKLIAGTHTFYKHPSFTHIYTLSPWANDTQIPTDSICDRYGGLAYVHYVRDFLLVVRPNGSDKISRIVTPVNDKQLNLNLK
jgi:hypothetical protein